MGWFGSKGEAADWRATEDALQAKDERNLDEKGQSHPDTKASYAAIVEHQDRKPGRLWGR